MPNNTPITVAHGDGIGPEIMDATLEIITAAKARIDIETIEIGEKVYLAGNNAGIYPSAWESLRRTKVFLKAPITTPQGGGYKSLNVTARKTLGLYANVRPCVSYHPYIKTKHPVMDVVIVRENEEDLYSGIEYRQTNDVMQGLKLITRPGCEKIIRYAFEYAREYNRKKVTAFMKDNIMKMTDGLFHKIFNEVGEEYPDIEKEDWIVDIGAAKMANSPEAFDVIVMENLYGDILSDVAAQIAGSVGLAGSANIGDEFAMFEAIHGSAPRRAGQNLANPSGLLIGSILMLVHIKQPDIASLVYNAWLKTIEDGVHTYDIFHEGTSKTKVGTKEFAKAVVERLGEKPKILKPVEYKYVEKKAHTYTFTTAPKAKKELVGVDVFIDFNGTPNHLGDKLKNISVAGLKIAQISNRGIDVWPNGQPDIFCVDHWRCRFIAEKQDGTIKHSQINEILAAIDKAGYDSIKTENLYTFDGVKGFSTTEGK
ncbi:MAG: NADP-dependent isocitrate dehydrogenase [Ignavibacteria bacterium]